MNIIQQVAVSKVVSEDMAKLAKGEIRAGVHKGEFFLKVSYNLKKGDSFNMACVNKIPWDKLFAAALSKLNGVTVEMLVELALADDKSGITDEVKNSVQKQIDKIKGTTTTLCNGQVRGTVEAEIVTVPDIKVEVQ